MQKLVSIVIPTFCAARWLGETLESIRRQSYRPIEVIVSDGGSTDSTAKIVQSYDDIIVHFRSSPDDGPADALNRGIAQAKGDLIGYINGDDSLAENSIAEACETLCSEAMPALVYRDIEFIDEFGKRRRGYGGKLTTYCPGKYDIVDHRVGSLVVPQQGSFWNRACQQLVGEFDPSIKTAFDGHWYARAAVGGAKIIYRPGIGGAFRVHEAAISYNFANKPEWKDAYQRVEQIWIDSKIELPSGARGKILRARRMMFRLSRHIALGKW